MKHLFTLIILISAGLCSAQIPNKGFENWTQKTLESIDDWYLFGNAFKSSDAPTGSSAILLENRMLNQSSGIVTNVDLAIGSTEGSAYSESPLAVTFDLKYNLYSGDVGKIIVIFKAQGFDIGGIDFSISGNSADTFIHYTVPVQWLVSTTPDMVNIMVSSLDPASTAIYGDGDMIIDNIAFESMGTPNAALDNAGFEDWTGSHIDHPASWYSTDLFVNEYFGLTEGVGSVVQSSDANSGASAALLQNVSVGGFMLPGILVSGQSENLVPAFPVSEQWKYLHGYYKFNSDNNDTASISVTMYNAGHIVGMGYITISESSSQTEYTYFSVPIDYAGGSDIPDSAGITILSAYSEEVKGLNTKLWIDDIDFANHTAKVDDIQKPLFKLYPIPVNHTLNVQISGAQNYSYSISDMTGRKLISSTENNINVETLLPGVYFINIIAESGAVQSKKFVKQ